MKPVDSRFYADRGNAVDLLRAEYAQIWDLCERYRNSMEDGSGECRTRLAHELCRLISICSLVEQEVIYPEVRKVNEDLVFDLLLAHDEINACVVEIRTLTPDDMDYDLEMMRLIDAVQAHIRASERSLFPLIEREVSSARLRPLTTDFVRRRLLLDVTEHERGRDALTLLSASGGQKGAERRVHRAAS